MKLLVTGAAGMLGRNVVERARSARSDLEVVPVSRADIDLRDEPAVRRLFGDIRPDAVVHAAAKVGGVGAKIATPTPFLLDNLRMDAAVISAARSADVGELLYIGSAAVYPAAYERPYVESDILTGAVEPANEGYAIAKLAAIRLCDYIAREDGTAFRAAVPSNLYGPYDHYDAATAHLIAAALGKVHAAVRDGLPTVEVWGDGTARREFTYVGDLAAWILAQIGRLSFWPAALNLGCGVDHSIADYYREAARVAGYTGEFVFDPTKPAGVPRRLLDSSAARELGWAPGTDLATGIAATYDDLIASSAKDPR